MIQLIVDHPDAARHDLSGTALAGLWRLDRSARRCSTARSELLPQVDFVQAYGMTELGPCATALPAALHSAEGRARGKLRSGGRGAAGRRRCASSAPRVHELPRGEVGEIIVSSPSVMLGYWNRPEETAQALQRVPNPGWMHTGDGGRMDDEGFLYIVDRVKDMIVSGGENVHSTEVERAVARHPAVAACAVIGVPDDDWGERVHAVVVLKSGQQATADDIQQHCGALIGGYKCPKSVEFIAALPMTGAGKVLKRTLREPYWKGQQRQVA
jgi:acyl-CoA synthetase (AMP-forming)/AMP-acid ligase II